jgi:pilus assembly protein Flp/PilA
MHIRAAAWLPKECRGEFEETRHRIIVNSGLSRSTAGHRRFAKAGAARDETRPILSYRRVSGRLVAAGGRRIWRVPMKNLALSVRRFLVSEDGPTAVEYAVMLALIVIVCLTAITSIGSKAATTFSNVAASIGGAS